MGELRLTDSRTHQVANCVRPITRIIFPRRDAHKGNAAVTDRLGLRRALGGYRNSGFRPLRFGISDWGSGIREHDTSLSCYMVTIVTSSIINARKLVLPARLRVW